MSTLTQWLDHRMEVVGLNRWKNMSKYSGLRHQTIRDMNTCGSLDMLSRSERRLLAASLRVSLRKLEQLDAGKIEWIEDKHICDVGVDGRPAPGQENDPAYWVPKETKPDDRGTPVIGSIRPTGTAEPDEAWQEESGRHIPQRFGKGKDIYGLELEASASPSCSATFPPGNFAMAWQPCTPGTGGRPGAGLVRFISRR